ncbi:MAG TPA: sterol desaturase family protein [Polyangia bacterium]|jgi:lathosterol oxidase|nr:sterol desaturase family protein [Polyangia bacterium]
MSPLSVVALVVVINVSFFFVAGGLFHILVHRGSAVAVARRRHQPKKRQTRAMIRSKVPLVLVNGILLNGIVGAGIAISSGPLGAAYWHSPRHGLFHAALSTVALFFWYHLALFYFHRAMHGPRLFRAFHHLHHRFKAPMFLDALYEHPLEALYGAIVLVAPLFLFPVSLYGYLVFFAVVGVHEIVDHSGIDVDLPLLSRSRHHDDHHRRSNCYYGQLLPLLDRAHGSILVEDELVRRADRPAKAA